MQGSNDKPAEYFSGHCRKHLRNISDTTVISQLLIADVQAFMGTNHDVLWGEMEAISGILKKVATREIQEILLCYVRNYTFYFLSLLELKIISVMYKVRMYPFFLSPEISSEL